MAHKQLIGWLNDAHAMETSLAETLKRHADDAEGKPEVAERLRKHLEETKEHARRVESLIEKLGGDTSRSKEIMAKAAGSLGGLSAHGDDKLVKNAISDYAAEHMEIATYKALAEAATALGEAEVAETAEAILAEEEAMAAWLETNLPELVREHAEALA